MKMHTIVQGIHRCCRLLSRSPLSLLVAGLLLAFFASTALATVPIAPSNLVSAASSQTQITLTWADNSSDETRFKIERSATGTNGWTQIAAVSANVTNYANTGLVANALWYYRVCATNASGASAYTAVANAQTAYANEYGGTAVWRALLLVYPQTDAGFLQGGVSNHYTGTMNTANRDDGVWAFHQYCSLVNQLSAREGIMLGDVVYPGHAITHVTDMGGEDYWVDPDDIAADLDTYAPSNTYDTIFVYWAPGSIPHNYLGMGNTAPTGNAHGDTYANIIEWSGWTGEPAKGEAWLHEWLHGVCGYYQGQGYRQPNHQSDGKGEHGYNGYNWEYYRDMMQDLVWETNPPPSAYVGVPVQGWRQSGPHNHRGQVQGDWFYADSTSRYEKTGTVAYDSANLCVSLGAAGSADHVMWSPILLSGSVTLRASLNVPASPGASDYTAVAVTDGTNEWRAAVEYGTGLTKQLVLRRNGTAQSSNAMTLSSGWYTVKMELDYDADTIRAKAWKRDSNEPAT